MRPVAETIECLERLKAEIEWDYSLEYQTALDDAIERIKNGRSESVDEQAVGGNGKTSDADLPKSTR